MFLALIMHESQEHDSDAYSSEDGSIQGESQEHDSDAYRGEDESIQHPSSIAGNIVAGLFLMRVREHDIDAYTGEDESVHDPSSIAEDIVSGLLPSIIPCESNDSTTETSPFDHLPLEESSSAAFQAAGRRLV